jgi:hypothetical protein
MYKFLGSLALGVCLLTPIGTLKAQDHHDQAAQAHHQWNDGENQYWHQYLKEHHKKDHDWEKANKREQTDYWKWRDQHRDSH